MAIRSCKFGASNPFTEMIDDSLLDIVSGNTVAANAAYYLVTGKTPDPDNPGQYLGGTSGSTKPYLVVGYITPPQAASATLF